MNQARKKVLYLVTKATYGGAQRYVFDLATHLPKDRFEVVVAYGVPGRLEEMLRKNGVRAIRLPSLGRDVSVLADIRSFFEILSCFRDERPDVVHLNSSKAAALGALAARLVGVKKIIFTAHGWPFKEHRGVLSKAIIYFISWFTAFLSTSVITVSPSDEARGKRMWGITRKVMYIPLGIEAPAYPSREDASKVFALTETGRPRIVTIAELTKNKGLAYAIEAMGMLADRHIDFDYFIIGDGEERGRLEGQADERGILDRVHFLGFIPDASRYLRAFDVFLLPSIKEGMPYVVPEALAAQLPLIVTDAVDPSAVGDFAQVVPHADAAAIAAALQSPPSAHKSAEVVPITKMLEQTIALY